MSPPNQALRIQLHRLFRSLPHRLKDMANALHPFLGMILSYPQKILRLVQRIKSGTGRSPRSQLGQQFIPSLGPS